MDAEVAVVGVGSVGSMVAWRLAQQGLDVIGFEQFTPGHDRGAVGGDTRIFRLAYVEGETYLPILRQSQEAWRQLNDESGSDVFVEAGGLTIGEEDDPTMRQLIEVSSREGLEIEILGCPSVREQYPQHRLSPTEQAVFDPNAGFIRSDQAVVAATRQAELNGARIFSRNPVTRIEVRPGGVCVESQGVTWKVGTVVLAMGSWSRRFLPSAFAAVTEARRHLLSWFLPEGDSKFGPAAFPPFVRTVGDRFMYGTPSVDSTTVKLGGLAPLPIENIDSFDRRHSSTESSEMAEVVEKYFRGIRPDAVRADAYTDLFTTDRHGILGRLPGQESVIVASGFSGRGFKFVPAVGLAVADLVLGRENREFEFMSPARFL